MNEGKNRDDSYYEIKGRGSFERKNEVEAYFHILERKGNV